MIQFTCPRCQTLLSANPEQGGIKLTCPRCRQRLRVPQLDLERNLPGQPMAEKGPPPLSKDPGPGVSPASDPQLKAAHWYHTRAGMRCGPIPWAQLRYLAASGPVQAGDLVWTEGMPRWAPAGSIPGLFPPPDEGLLESGGTARLVFILTLPVVVGMVVGVLVYLAFFQTAPSKQRADKPGPAPPVKQDPPAARDDSGTKSPPVKPPVKKEENKPPKEEEQPSRDVSEQQLADRLLALPTLRTPSTRFVGFPVQPRILVTSARLIDGIPAADLQIEFPANGSSAKPRAAVPYVLSHDRKRDLAFLALPSDHAPLPVARDFRFEAGTRVITLHEIRRAAPPRGTTVEMQAEPGTLVEKITLDGQEFYRLSIPVEDVTSGAPVLNYRGQVVGVATWRTRGKEELHLAIPAESLREQLARVARIPAEDYPKLSAQYSSRAVFCRLVRAHYVYLAAIQQVVGVWDKALKDGKGAFPREELEKAGDAARRSFAEKNWSRHITADLADAVKHVGADPLVPPETRQKLNDLLASCQALEELFRKPAAPLQAYARKVADLLKAADERIKVLVGALDVEAADLKP